MTINQTQENGKIILAVKGRLDTTTSPQLHDVLIPAFGGAKDVILDITELAYISSAGLRVLLMGQKTAKAKDTTMTITGVSPEIMEIFEMTGFDSMLTIQ